MIQEWRKNMSKYYERTQMGYVITSLLAIVLFILLYYMVSSGFNFILIGVFLVIGVCLKIFSSLTVSIDDQTLKISFGSGIIEKEFYLKEIESSKIVKNRLYYGWGIHITPKGWLYNVSGFYSVQIKMKSGKRYLIGTDEPEKLKAVIEKSIDRF